jgi:rhodanese-related sulfurtransferase
MPLKPITPHEASELAARGAIVVDIRERDEHARERIPFARHHPLSKLGEGLALRPDEKIVIYHCRSGARTQANAGRLAAAGSPCETYLLEGGLDAWKKAGLPTAADARQPIEIMRQVQIAAGGLVVLGALLGALVSPYFHALSAFAGLGLVFAGVTGTCAMATLLGRMPWNRRGQAPHSTLLPSLH